MYVPSWPVVNIRNIRKTKKKKKTEREREKKKREEKENDRREEKTTKKERTMDVFRRVIDVSIRLDTRSKCLISWSGDRRIAKIQLVSRFRIAIASIY